MALEKVVTTISRLAEEDLAQYRFVTYSTTADTVAYPEAGGGKNLGVTRDAVSSSESVEIATEGIVWVYSTTAATRGDYACITGTVGKVTTAENATPASTEIVGVFEETTSDEGLVLINLKYNGLLRTV